MPSAAASSTNLEDYFLNRRQFLNRFGLGMGALGLATMLNPTGLLADPTAAPKAFNPMAPHPGNFPGKAKSVIHIFAQGAPSHIDTWDPKPALVKADGQPMDGSYAMGSPSSSPRWASRASR